MTLSEIELDPIFYFFESISFSFFIFSFFSQKKIYIYCCSFLNQQCYIKVWVYNYISEKSKAIEIHII